MIIVTWKNTFNTENKHWGHIQYAYDAALNAGYKFFSWNGYIYKVEKDNWILSHIFTQDLIDNDTINYSTWFRSDRPFEKYQIGTLARITNNSYWIKTENGWTLGKKNIIEYPGETWDGYVKIPKNVYGH